WPISYEEMEPYYTQAEELYQVHGLSGADPTEPKRSKPYPYPPISHEPRIQKLYDRLQKAGYHPFPAPSAIMLNEKNPHESRCVRCQTCDGFPCLVQAKADAEMIGIRPALLSSNVQLITNAKVVKLKTNPTGSVVTEVVAEVNGHPESFQGNLIVVACGAANTAKLLLMSSNENHRNGLANGSDQVGRNYMYHNSQAVLAISLEPNLTKFQKTLAINDFYFGTKEFPFPMGNIQMLGKSLSPMFKGEKPIETALVPKMGLEEIAKHSVDFWLSTEDLPDPNNRITLDRQGRITLSYTPNNQVSKQKLYEKFKSMLSLLELHESFLIPHNIYLKTDIPIAGCAHQAGTCRFGKDSKTSVLNTDCKAHELDNLYVVDASFFPSIGAVNPSLTVMANALRVGDHLLKRLK
ncbi:MAG: GMC family oxidoreductase, partial [Chlamydiae bacterium]|nr:GMC family oxidoreductase [Chlamydiota bacterium]